jgi:hypothetical protein
MEVAEQMQDDVLSVAASYGIEGTGSKEADGDDYVYEEPQVPTQGYPGVLAQTES